MAWFKKARKPIAASTQTSRVPEGLWVKCPECDTVIYTKDLIKNLHVCTKCSHHFRLSAVERLKMLCDEGEWVEHDAGLVSTDPLKFTDTKPYRSRLSATIKASGRKDAVVAVTGRIEGIETEIAAMEYSFIGGSMGVVVGETLTRAIERGLEHRGKRPSVLLLHSAEFGGSAETSWFNNIDALASRYHVLAPDHLGFGRVDQLDAFVGGVVHYFVVGIALTLSPSPKGRG